MMVGTNLTETQLQQIVDKTIVQLDKDQDGMISYEEFCDIIARVRSEYLSVSSCSYLTTSPAARLTQHETYFSSSVIL